MRNTRRGRVVKKPNDDGARIIIIAIMGVMFGYYIGVNFPFVAKTTLPSDIPLSSEETMTSSSEETMTIDESKAFEFASPEYIGIVTHATPRIYVPTNPRGAEPLPPGIVVPETDLYLRRLWGDPGEFGVHPNYSAWIFQDLKKKPKYLVAFTVGWGQRDVIDASVKKFSEDFQILLFHYDGRTTEWDRYEWSKQAIHVSVKGQTKWWYAKRFLHPDVVAPYEYIFIWDEDLGVEHFNGDRYIYLVKKYGLAISQPGLEPNKGLTWQMTKRRGDKEVHNFVEIMAPVFSREAWRCVWHIIQNDLVHGWGLDFALRRCVEPAHEKIGVVDSQWIVHQVITTLGGQVKYRNLYISFIVS
ncbi:hypothetical protein OSB04_013636 [Centaurea solstitialis]|uniref:Storage protein n=1 Tax=Centaurea solstitialis TaxID=347529 RepID=A0AA38WFP3_9ASTR|nr:hypothetical protein OSB04_013636 [Centaurea solstitialis]